MNLQNVKPATIASRNHLLWRLWSNRWIYAMLLFPMTFFILFKYVPLYGIQLAFKDYVLAGVAESPWNDFAHFKFMISQPAFFSALGNTLIISLMRLLIAFPFPILLALLLNEIYNAKFRRVLQTIYTFPHFLSWVLLAGILTNLLGSGGMIRKVIMSLDQTMGENWNLLFNNDMFRWVVVLSDMWKEGGWGTIIYLAAITGIDAGLYEAAVIDGSNRWQKMLYITLPGIMNMIAIQFVLKVGASMEGGFDQIFNMYSAPVLGKGDIIDTYIYRLSFQQASSVNLGFPTAVGLFKNVINFSLLLVANFVTKSLGQETVL